MYYDTFKKLNASIKPQIQSNRNTVETGEP